MANPPISFEEAEARILAIEERLREGHPPPGVSTGNKMGAIRAAAKSMGAAKGSAQSWYQSALRVAGRTPNWSLYGEDRPVEFPDFPDDDIPAPEILDHMARRFEKRAAHNRAKTWFDVRIKDNRPLGICWFGDPHLGSNGCNVPLLLKTVETVNATEGMYAANIGDTADNWGGRLVHLYSENDVSKSTERKLARWLLKESGLPWFLWLYGNHEHMDKGFQTYLDAINARVVPMVDWRAQFRMVFPDHTFTVDAAHNHKGHSMWNELHGQERAARMAGRHIDLCIAGDKHCWAVKKIETENGVSVLARVRGFKYLDDYAFHRGFASQSEGAAIVTIFDPLASASQRVTAWPDVEAGADYLTWLRGKR